MECDFNANDRFTAVFDCGCMSGDEGSAGAASDAAQMHKREQRPALAIHRRISEATPVVVDSLARDV